jgi:hypothetical protein
LEDLDRSATGTRGNSIASIGICVSGASLEDIKGQSFAFVTLANTPRAPAAERERFSGGRTAAFARQLPLRESVAWNDFAA